MIGGGNVAVDVALTAKRLGAKNVTLVCLEKREEMPAWTHEIQEALESDIKIVNSFGPKAFFIDKSRRVSGLEFKTCTAVFDENRRFNPQFDESVCTPMFADTVIIAIGQSTDRSHLDGQGIAFTRPGGIQADPVTLQTPIEWVFAGGDVYHGPKSVVEAVACGKEAAESIHRYINGLDLRAGREKEWEHVKPETAGETKHARVPVRCLDPGARECNFLEVSFGYDETEARMESQRCLRCGICSECYQCVKACLAKAVDHTQQPRSWRSRSGRSSSAPASDPYDPSALENVYHYRTSPNVVTSLEFERILSATGPTMGHLKRMADDREPKRIAWLQCIGSRDNNQCGNGYCSSVCCMYAMKDAMIAKEHAHGDLDCTIFNMDIRSFGKDYEKYYNRAIGNGIRFVRSRVHSVDVLPETGNLSLRYVDEAGGLQVEEYDMVVLSVGLQVPKETVALAERLKRRPEQVAVCGEPSLHAGRDLAPGRLRLRRVPGPQGHPELGHRSGRSGGHGRGRPGRGPRARTSRGSNSPRSSTSPRKSRGWASSSATAASTSAGSWTSRRCERTPRSCRTWSTPTRTSSPAARTRRRRSRRRSRNSSSTGWSWPPAAPRPTPPCSWRRSRPAA